MSGWPFVGRDAEQERIARLLGATPPTGALIAGEQGVGKTRLAAVAREQAGAAGFEVRHVLAGSATRAIPFGALATLLPVIRDVADNSQAALGPRPPTSPASARTGRCSSASTTPITSTTRRPPSSTRSGRGPRPRSS